MAENKHLFVIVGPTAVGKTALSLSLARYFATEIISADARQFYQEMNIGTAKPSPAELNQVPHHFIHHLSIHTPYSAGHFEQAALAQLAHIFQQKNTAIVVGGSGLYIRALCEGMDEMPPESPLLRAQLSQQWQNEGLAPLQAQLQALDPLYFAQVDLQNPHRLIRALEVCLSTGKPYSQFRARRPALRPFQLHKIGLELPREALYARIDTRMEAMLAAGLRQEAETLYAHRQLPALQTVGYTEIFDFLDGAYDWEECVRLLKRNSRRYAKRQLTWFRREAGIRWFSPEQEPDIITHLEQQMMDS
ncbi:MAG: tRNA (adenosine(37)-N6)-dimethylallyltransferase MiaA [Microscillaceae bacterium]|nr:tRNA (adenosine(37)-N6)-dimethylallyltransferase MiaA [Microscillaceae bacterium]